MSRLTLLLLLLPMLPLCRHISRLRRGGQPDAALRLYRRAAFLPGSVVLLSMLAQEALLLFSGMLTWATGLPLHLCSLMGLLTLPALLTRRETLLHALLCAGMPGAALALFFPAVAETAHPRVTAFFFCLMHAGIALAPLLPMSLGWCPRPAGVGKAFCFLLFAACIVSAANAITGGNYLFLARPVVGTPLMALARWGTGMYRALLMLLAALLLAGEAALFCIVQSNTKCFRKM